MVASLLSIEGALLSASYSADHSYQAAKAMKSQLILVITEPI
jgi:hypothetical protein